ncbi:hypothetical protein [Brucella anthropi]|uniref:hypothetical protein n=1 Tax=Brucella anthropi TaxID=529 RepID=UPI0038513BB6
MPWVRFKEVFNFPATPAVTQRYPAGFTGNVTTRCADMAEAQGKIERINTPRKGEAPHGDQGDDTRARGAKQTVAPVGARRGKERG